jgi:hypothetical protein
VSIPLDLAPRGDQGLPERYARYLTATRIFATKWFVPRRLPKEEGVLKRQGIETRTLEAIA